MTPEEDRSRFAAIRKMVSDHQEHMRAMMIQQQEMMERQQQAIDALVREHAESRRIFEAFQARAETEIEWLKATFADERRKA